MTTNNTVTLQSLLQFALPLGTTLMVGSAETTINWATTIRAQPPAFPEIYGGELALLSMELLRSYNNRMTLSEVIESLADVDVQAIAVKGDVSDVAIATAASRDVSLLALSDDNNLTTVERAVNALIVVVEFDS